MVSALTTAVGILYRSAEGRNGKAIEELENRVTDLDTRLQAECKARLDCERERYTLAGEVFYLKQIVSEHEKKIN